MKNKGFGLISLLAVVVIIMLIIVLSKQFTILPSDTIVKDNDPKKSTFIIEVKNVYNEANRKYIEESIKGNILDTISSNDLNNLNMSSKLDYCIKYDNGTVSSMKVSNEKYHIIYTKNIDINKLTESDIINGKLEDMSC